MKKMKMVFLVGILAILFAGCTNEQDAKEIEKETTEITTEIASEEITEEASTEAVEDVTEALTEEQPVEEVEIPTPFEFILNNIYDSLLLDPMTDEITCVHYSTGISEVALSGTTADDRLNAVAYRIMDVNEDGVLELLILDNAYEDNDKARILDMYTIVEGTPVRVIEGWARNRFYMLEDGNFYCSGSGGAAYSMDEILTFEIEAIELTTKEIYFTGLKEDGTTIAFYYNAEGVYDASVSTEITEEQYTSFVTECENKSIAIEAKPMGMFK